MFGLILNNLAAPVLILGMAVRYQVGLMQARRGVDRLRAKNRFDRGLARWQERLTR
jgi:hypothetical protein